MRVLARPLNGVSDEPDARWPGAVPLRIVVPSVALVMLLLLAPMDPIVDRLIGTAIVAASIVFIVRQGVLLRERTTTLAKVTALTHENERLLGELRVELDRRARNERKMIAASRLAAVGELAAGVAHEVNNPLTGVLGYAEILLLELEPGDPARPDVEVIRDEALRARSIVRALRDFANPNAPALAPTDMAELVHQTIDLVRYSTERRGVTIHEELESLPAALIDRNAIQQAILNVITNAGQAVDADGRIDVTLRAEGDQQIVSITDDGVGMDDATAHQAFEPFFSSRDPGPEEAASNGLGLSISAGLIESHGGTIAIRSQRGHGTTVEIRLPATPDGDQVELGGRRAVA
jgi:signal transduction histidine kinase